ncbi:rhomboid family intramembrane serine protease [candidate division KSB1 bacterium]|nr:rhomboid family intramembrane serine protease [candidate division KSB1 bacterium]
MIPLNDENPTQNIPFITYTIITVNILVFFNQFLFEGSGFVIKYGTIPYEITHFREIASRPEFQTPFANIFTLFTSMFIHGGFFHIASNMLFLWIFGDNVEDLMGSFRFLLFYLLTGLIASLAQIIIAPSSTIPMVGASGAISGVLGAYFLKFPKAKVKVLIIFIFFIQVISVPAVIVLGFWFLMQIMSGFTSLDALDMGGVAWFAHIGGFIAGLIFVNKFQKRKVQIWY